MQLAPNLRTLIPLLLCAVALVGTAACSDDGAPELSTATEQPIATDAIAPGVTVYPVGGDGPAVAAFAELSDARLYYEVYGEDHPLLLIPSLSSSHLTWVDQIEPYSTEFQVIVYDPRGTGQSSPLAEGTYGIGEMADDAVAVLDAAGVSQAHVYGISMGGMVAQELVLRHPERVASLILGATTPGGDEGTAAETWAMVTFLGQADPEGEGRSILDVLYSASYRADHMAEIEAGLSRIGDYPATTSEAIVAQIQAAAAHDTYDRLPEIDSPTLVMHGTDDPLIPVANGRLLMERIPNAELRLFPGVRHSFRTEVEEMSNALVMSFLLTGVAAIRDD